MATIESEARPLVSVLLATHERPELLDVAVRCLRAQTWQPLEVLVLDDGSSAPVDPSSLDLPNARVVRWHEQVPLGVKLNEGSRQAQGKLLIKMDDDDWYGPSFVERMAQALLQSKEPVSVAFAQPFVFFELDPWRLRRADRGRCAGSTFTFWREDWERAPFRPVAAAVDGLFLCDQLARGKTGLPVPLEHGFLAVRHRRHIWNAMPDGTPLARYLDACKPSHLTPEDALPDWALTRYRSMQARWFPRER